MAANPDAETDALVDALAQTAYATTATLTRLAAELELTLAQLRMLGALRGRRARMAELAAHLGLEKSSVSGLIERAEARGLVRRERSSGDGRAVEVFLTSFGEGVAHRATARARDLLTPLVGGLTAAEQRQLRTLLERSGPPSPAQVSAGR